MYICISYCSHTSYFFFSTYFYISEEALKHATPEILGETMALKCCNKRHHEPSPISITFVSTFLRFLCHLRAIGSFYLCHFWNITPYIRFLCHIFWLFVFSPFSLYYFSIFFVIFISFPRVIFLFALWYSFSLATSSFSLCYSPQCDSFSYFLSAFSLHNISVFFVLYLVPRPEINCCKMTVNADKGNRSLIFSSSWSGCSPCRWLSMNDRNVST